MIEGLIDFLRTLTTPERLLNLLTTVFSGWWAYVLFCSVVFAETGLLTGFFLPGDSFLFTIGVVLGAAQLNYFVAVPLLMASAVLGDSTGYWLGRRTGPRIFSRPNSRLFRRDHLERSQEFYQKHGGKTIIYAKFVPIIRTFAPFVAGVAGMSYPRFLSVSVVGAVLWVGTITTLGHTLGAVPLVRRHFEKVIILIIVVSLVPVLIEALKARRKRAPASAQ